MYKEIYMYVLGAAIVLGFMTLLGILILTGIPSGNSELLLMTVGALIAMATQVVSYFYGSSKGSSDKNQMLNDKQSDGSG